MPQFSKNAGILYLIPSILAPETEGAVMAPVVKEVASHLDYFLVEELRTARRYLSALGVPGPIESLQFEVLNKKTDPPTVAKLLEPVKNGRSAGIISEAGSPGVADPGAVGVALAHKMGIKVVPLPGPSSFLLALMASGFTGQQFAFHGYLPIKPQEREQALKQLEKESSRHHRTEIFMETPYRNDQMMQAILKTCASDTLICVAAGLTGPEEYIQTKSIKDWKAGTVPSIHKIPAVFLLFRS